MNPYAIRLPSTFCCPTQPLICCRFSGAPFEPATAIACSELSLLRCFMMVFCVWFAIVFSSLFTDHSKYCSIVLPGCFSSCLCCPCWIRLVTFRFAFAIRSITSFMVSGVGTMSPSPTENPRFISQ